MTLAVKDYPLSEKRADLIRTRTGKALSEITVAALKSGVATMDDLRITKDSLLLQAEIAACHARAHTATETDWARIVAIYDALGHVTPSPVVALNRAVAVSMAEGPAAGLVLVDALLDEPALKSYHLLPGVRGDLLFKLDRKAEAKVEFERAASMTRNERERTLLLKRAAEC